jgi:hypothetical protein
MKLFDDLTTAELAALSEQEIERYVDLACAEAGVALLPEVPIAPDPVDRTKPDREVYRVDGTFFVHRAHAEQVASLATSFSRYRPNYAGNDYSTMKVQPDPDPVEVRVQLCFSEEFYNTRAAAIEAHDEAHRSYVAGRRTYDDIVQKRLDIRRPMQARISHARNRTYKCTRLRAEHERYLDLAEGNRRVAARFLAAAYADAEELIPDVFNFTPADPPDPRPRSYNHNEQETAARADSDIPF